MKNIWLKKIKEEAYWIKKTGLIWDLVILFLAMGFFMSWIVDIIKKDSENHIKIEKTGYVESLVEGAKSTKITLTNGERYRISDIMRYDGYFDRDEFFDEVKYGDELHFVIWQDDKNGFIYQLECNGKEYFSYKQAMAAKHRANIFMLIGDIIWFLVCVRYLIITLQGYVKVRRNKGEQENV